MPRYEFHCVAPGVYGGPIPTDDLYEALLATASYDGSHWDIWDTVKREYVTPICSAEELAELQERLHSNRTDPALHAEGIDDMSWPTYG